MAFVEIYKLKNDGSQEVTAVCRLNGATVHCEGETAIVDVLDREGIRDYSITPFGRLSVNDGIKFLEQLQYNFKSGYLNASEVKHD